MTEIGKRIKHLRQLKDLTQEELGNRLGVSKATVNKYESGVVSNFSRPRIEQLAEILETSPSYLLGWDESDTEANARALERMTTYNMKIQQITSEDHLSQEERELLRIYNKVSVRSRMKILQLAYELEEGES